MNVWSARAVMNENNLTSLRLCLFACLFLAGTAQARAAGAAPSLLGIQEVLVKAAHLGNGPASDTCGLSGSKISDLIIKELKTNQIASYSDMSAPVHNMVVARVELLPEVVTLYGQGLDCTSWISLSAQTRESVTIPPIKAPRSVSIIYWRGGLLISSGQSTHPQAVNEALEKLTASFAKKYHYDQPPPLPDLDAPLEEKGE